jgi:hypothetical protein
LDFVWESATAGKSASKLDLVLESVWAEKLGPQWAEPLGFV